MDNLFTYYIFFLCLLFSILDRKWLEERGWMVSGKVHKPGLELWMPKAQERYNLINLELI